MRKEFIIIGIIFLLLVGGVFFLLLSSPDKKQSSQPQTTSPTPLTKPVALGIKGGKVVSGPSQIEVKQGEIIEFTITSDTDEQFYLQGYDKTLTLLKDRPVKLMFTAETAGKFIFRLTGANTDIGTLTVTSP